MALMHHDGRDKNEAAASAADWARNKLDDMIQRGRAKTVDVLDQVESMKIEDVVAPANGIRFWGFDGKLTAEVLNGDSPSKSQDYSLHPNALGQIMGRTGGTNRVAEWAYTKDTAPEFASILNKKVHAMKDRRFLLRNVEGEMRAFLSDRYRRIDVRPMVTALVETAIRKFGAVPISAAMRPTSFDLKLVLPTIFEPLPNEVGVFGLVFRSSDFGCGKLWGKGFFNRLWCTNLAMTEDGISQVHLGRVLSDDIAFSQRTYELDTEAMASAIRDVVAHIFSPDNIMKRMEAVKAAAEEVDGADIAKVLKGLSGKSGTSGLTKTEATAVTEKYNSADVALLPPGQSKWRLSNAISLIAQEVEDGERQLELEALAGKIAGLAKE